MIGSLFIPKAFFYNNSLSYTSLPFAIAWMFSPMSLETILGIAFTITICLISTEKP